VKVVYLLQNRGIEHRTPAGWQHAVISAGPDGSYSEADLREVEDADFLVVGLEPVDERLLGAAKQLRLVQRIGRGHSNIDLEAAARRGIPVAGMPDFNAATVAEHAMMLMLALLRRIFESTLLMKAGRWPVRDVVTQGVFDLTGRTVGVVGLGAIGHAVATRLQAFDTRVLYTDPGVEGADDFEAAPLDRLLSEADIVTLHVPLNAETRGMIGREQLGWMKPAALLVNTARGALVDELALAEALQAGRIAGAGLDVFADEPLDAAHPLRRCRNVLLTPHTAGQTREAMERMVAMMIENLERVSAGEPALHQIFAPAGVERVSK
jgi:phosphoglycerate dehydrogenase-like enzyme